MKKLILFSRYLWLILLLSLLLVLIIKLKPELNFAYVKEHQLILQTFINDHYFVAVGCFIFLYIILVALSFPGASFFTVLAGFLFGIYLGTLYVLIGATTGSLLIFLLVRKIFTRFFKSKNKLPQKMQSGFQKNAVSYLLFLRLLPIFPFWAVNIAAALFNVDLFVFVIITFIGIIPGTLIYVVLGSGLASIFMQNQEPNMLIIFEPKLFIPLALLAIFSLLPIIYRRKR